MALTVNHTKLVAAFKYAIKKAKAEGINVVEYSGWSTRNGNSSKHITKLHGLVVHHTGSEIASSGVKSYASGLATGSIRPDIGRILCNTTTVRPGKYPGSKHATRSTIIVNGADYANHAGLGDKDMLIAIRRGLSTSREWKPNSNNIYGNEFFFGDEGMGAYRTAQQTTDCLIFYAHVFHHLGLSVDAAPIIGHREWTARKNDPGKTNMAAVRREFLEIVEARYGKKPVPVPAVTPRVVSAKSLKGTILAQHRTSSSSLAKSLKSLASQGTLTGAAWSAFIARWSEVDKGVKINTTPPKGLPGNGHVFVMLGSGLKPNGTMSAKHLRRLKLVLAALKAYPNSHALISGGAPKSGVTEGALGKKWLISQGIASSRIIAETQSASTVGNARYSVAILKAKGYKSYTLVTDASHWRRGSALFAAATAAIQESTKTAWKIDVVSNLVFPDSTSLTKKVASSETSTTHNHVAILLGLTSEYGAALSGGYPTLRVGSKGEWVEALQRKLKVTVDGVFGPKTEAAVIAYQTKKKLTVDGIAGPITLKALGVKA